MVFDPLADFFTRIRNASMVKQATVIMPHSKIKESFARILQQEGFIQSYAVVNPDDIKKQLKLNLKYRETGEPAMTKLRRISKLSKRIYVRCSDIPKPRNGFGIVFLFTNKGVLTGKQARLAGVGGELVGEVY